MNTTTDQDELDPKSRKKLQNRVAQRKYRDRLKARISDLEERASFADDFSQALENTARSLPQAAHSQHGSLQRGRSSPPSARRRSSQMLMPDVPSSEDQRFDNEWLNGHHSERYPNHVFTQIPNLDDEYPLSETTLTAGPDSSTLTVNSLDFSFDADTLSANDATLNAPPQSSEHNRPLSGTNHSLDYNAIAKTTSGSKNISKVVSRAPADACHTVSDANSYIQTQSEGHRRPSQSLSLDIRMTSILEAAKLQGFGSFDDMVSAYYTGLFEVGSQLQIAQKLSRNRRIPEILQAIRDSARKWTRWEANGYEDEIIRSAEAVLVDEFDRATAVLVDHKKNIDQSADWLSLSETCTTATVTEPDKLLKTDPKTTTTTASSLQEDLPHLWALIISLVSDENAAAQAIRCRLLLALVSKTAVCTTTALTSCMATS